MYLRRVFSLYLRKSEKFNLKTENKKSMLACHPEYGLLFFFSFQKKKKKLYNL
jgi:hypothetical protein